VAPEVSVDTAVVSVEESVELVLAAFASIQGSEQPAAAEASE
jgi:hypothetical protein